MEWKPNTYESQVALARIQLGLGVSFFGALILTLFTLPVSIIVNAAFSGEVSVLETLSSGAFDGVAATALLLVFGLIGLSGGFFSVKAGLERLDGAEELNKRFNRTPEAEGPDKPGDSGGRAG